LPAFDAGQQPETVEASSIASNKLLVDAPSVLFSRLNPATNRTWLCGPSVEHDVTVCSTEYAVLHPREISVGALWAVLCSGQLGETLAVSTTGTSASHQRINEAMLLEARVPDVRTLDLSLKEEIDRCAATYVRLSREIASLRETREVLLPGLVSGELRVQAAEELVEATL
jgi:type I restriction enzyme S subunit